MRIKRARRRRSARAEATRSMQFTVLITPRTFARYDPAPLDMLRQAGCTPLLNPYGRILTEDELCALVPQADGIIVGLDPLSERVLARAVRLRAISKYGTGIDNIDLAAATRRGIVVTNTPAANSAAVAELALGLMLAVARRIAASDRGIRQGRWENQQGFQLWGKALGILGTGRIGREVALRARGFSMRLLCWDAAPDAAWARQMGAVYKPLEAVLGEADIVSLHLPLTPQTRHIFGARELARMKHGAVLINTARGALVDEQALLAALREERLAGAGLDVWETTPAADTPLAQLASTVLTAHIGAHTREAGTAMGIMAVRNLLDILKGALPADTLNPEAREQ
jgi:D-3-phosphoglycerate dehydrogenase